MEIEVIRTEQLKVELTEQQTDEVMFKRLSQLLNWNDGYFIEKGRVMEKIRYNASKPFDIDEEVRVASNDDFLAEDLFLLLKEKLEEENGDRKKG